MEIYELSNKEFWVILLKKFSKLQECTDRQNWEDSTQISKFKKETSYQ